MQERIKFIFSRNEDDAAIYAIRLAINYAIEHQKELLFFIKNGIDSQKKRVHTALRFHDKVGNFDPSYHRDVERLLKGIKFIVCDDGSMSASSVTKTAEDKGITDISDYVVIIDDESDEKLPSPSTVFGLNLLRKRKKLNIFFHKTITESLTAHEVRHLKECSMVSRPSNGDDPHNDVFSAKHILF